MLRTLSIPRSLARRTFVTSTLSRADKANGGFGEQARQETGQGKPKDSAPYSNEYTKSGTNTEVAHNEESYSSNTDPTRSNQQQGEALDSSPANASASKSADPAHSNKTHRDTDNASGFKSNGNSNASGSGNRAADLSKSKFEKLSQSNDDIQTVGGRKVTN